MSDFRSSHSSPAPKRRKIGPNCHNGRWPQAPVNQEWAASPPLARAPRPPVSPAAEGGRAAAKLPRSPPRLLPDGSPGTHPTRRSLRPPSPGNPSLTSFRKAGASPGALAAPPAGATGTRDGSWTTELRARGGRGARRQGVALPRVFRQAGECAQRPRPPGHRAPGVRTAPPSDAETLRGGGAIGAALAKRARPEPGRRPV